MEEQLKVFFLKDRKILPHVDWRALVWTKLFWERKAAGVPVNNELKVHSRSASIVTDPAWKIINQKKRKRRENARETDFMAIREGEKWMIPAERKTEAKRPVTPWSRETRPRLSWLNHTIIHHLRWWWQRMKNTTYTVMSIYLASHYSHLQPCLKGIWVGFTAMHWWEDSQWVTENKTGLEQVKITTSLDELLGW